MRARRTRHGHTTGAARSPAAPLKEVAAGTTPTPAGEHGAERAFYAHPLFSSCPSCCAVEEVVSLLATCFCRENALELEFQIDCSFACLATFIICLNQNIRILSCNRNSIPSSSFSLRELNRSILFFWEFGFCVDSALDWVGSLTCVPL